MCSKLPWGGAGAPYDQGKRVEKAAQAKRQLKARRTLTPLLLDHTSSDTLVEMGGLRAVIGDIPQWCKRPDYETTMWLNMALAQLWPQLSAALSTTIGNVVGRILGRISPLGLQLSFKEFNLGTEALSILSCKKVGDNKTCKDEVVLDLEVRWCGDPTVVLNVVFMGLTLEVRLDELQIDGNLRLVLANFDDKLPCFHMLKVAFVEQPDVRFSLSLIGGDIDLIPGVSEAITDIIGKGLGKALVWPKYIRVPIAKKKGDDDDDGEGGVGVSRSDAAAILEVTLRNGENLANMSVLGVSDPYVTMKVSNSTRPEQKSSVVVDDLNPEWNENFKVILDDPSSQTLQFVVADYSVLAEDVKIKQIEKTIEKIETVCCGWGHKARKKIYQGVKTVTTGKSAAESGEKLAKKETDKQEQGALFQTIMGTGTIKLNDLKPFEEYERKVVLTKDALNILTVFKKLGVLEGNQRQTEAGCLYLRLRLIPLAARRKRTQSFSVDGAASKDQIDRYRKSMNAEEEKSFMQRYGKTGVEAGEGEGSTNSSARVSFADVSPAAGSPASSFKRSGSGGSGSPSLASADSKPVKMMTNSIDFDAAAVSSIDHLIGLVLSGTIDKKVLRDNMLKLKPHLNGLLYVELVKGESLVSKDVNGLSDPYFKIKLRNQKWTSRVIYKTLNPVYNDQLELIVSPSDLFTDGVVIKVECWDKDIVGKEYMGETTIELRDVVKKSLSSAGSWKYERVELEGVESGAVHLKFRFQPVDISLRENTTKLLAGYAASNKDKDKRRPMLRVPSGGTGGSGKHGDRPGDSTGTPTLKSPSTPAGTSWIFGGRGPKGTKIKPKTHTAHDDDEDDDDSFEDGSDDNNNSGNLDEFDFGTDEEEAGTAEKAEEKAEEKGVEDGGEEGNDNGPRLGGGGGGDGSASRSGSVDGVKGILKSTVLKR